MARINLGCRKLSETATKPSIYLRFKVLIALGLLAILIASGLGIGYKTAFGETSRNQRLHLVVTDESPQDSEAHRTLISLHQPSHA